MLKEIIKVLKETTDNSISTTVTLLETDNIKTYTDFTQNLFLSIYKIIYRELRPQTNFLNVLSLFLR